MNEQFIGMRASISQALSRYDFPSVEAKAQPSESSEAESKSAICGKDDQQV